jgi:hypothetical protein
VQETLDPQAPRKEDRKRKWQIGYLYGRSRICEVVEFINTVTEQVSCAKVIDKTKMKDEDIYKYFERIR